MDLELTISERAAEWLERKAQAAGTDEASIAAGVIERLAEQELANNGANGASSDERLRFFREWMSGLKPRPGPTVDPRRETIYD